MASEWNFPSRMHVALRHGVYKLLKCTAAEMGVRIADLCEQILWEALDPKLCYRRKNKVPEKHWKCELIGKNKKGEEDNETE